jgi:hypothetical protein
VLFMVLTSRDILSMPVLFLSRDSLTFCHVNALSSVCALYVRVGESPQRRHGRIWSIRPESLFSSASAAIWTAPRDTCNADSRSAHASPLAALKERLL